MDDIIAEFIAETNDSLGDLDNDLVMLEQHPDNDELISRIFRILHTIKGTCGFLGLSRLEKVAHKGEDVLGLFRDKKLKVTPAYVSLILKSFDSIKEIIAGIEATGQEPPGDDSPLISQLEAAYRGEEIFSEMAVAGLESDQNQEMQADSVVESSPKMPVQSDQPGPAHPAAEEKQADGAHANMSLRVNVEVLENLMTMVSELVLTRNQLLQISRQQKETDFLGPLQRLNLVVSELQEGVMKTRMQPVGNAWSKLPRIVRDVSKELGKKIDLEMYGQDTELDRQVLDMIKDPLTHMVRNSIDHGIEVPAERVAKGKPETGRIVLNAYHQGGHINIEISDDGRGLPLDKIKKKVLQNGLATEDQLNAMSAQQIQQYIFHAGLSTAEKVTAVSGRGVGMDVVRTNIEKIGGSIEMRSEEGKGTTFIIKIPLTLAIVSALIVGVSGHRFAIPQLTISELVLAGKDSGNRIETINDAPVLRLRENLLPLISLSSLLGVKKEGNQDATQYVIVTKVGAYMFGLIVDQVYDLEEIVVKPLSRNLKEIAVFSGNTILGDGSVIMILDPAGILKTVGVQEIVDNKMEGEGDNLKPAGKENLLLLFKAGNETLKAVPVDMVSRLEEVQISDIEISRGKQVIQYHDALMPIHNLDQGGVPNTRRPLIILRHGGKSAGLLVDQILDVAKYYGDIRGDNDSDVVDSIIIQEQAADVINARSLAEKGIVVNEGGARG